MTTRRLNKTVNALRAYLARHDVPHPDKVAKALLRCIEQDTDGNPVINVSSKGPFATIIGKSLSATDLRAQLVKAGLLTQTSFDGFRQWTLAYTDKLVEYRTKYAAENRDALGSDPAIAAMETRLKKGLAKQSQDLTKQLALAHEQLVQHQGALSQNQGQLMSLEMKIEDHQAQITALWDAIKHIEQFDAPVTIEKIQRHLKAV